MLLRRLPLFAWILVCLGCGNATPPPKAAAPGVTSAPVAEPAPELSPVAAPEELVMVGRWARPRTVVETSASWLSVPVKLTDLLPAEARELEAVVAWDAPVEAAAMLDPASTAKMPAGFFVLSVGLSSVDAAVQLARSRGLSSTRVAPGIFRIAFGGQVSCAISAAVGPARARLVCGQDWADVEALLPYATRGLPTRDLGRQDVHIEVRAAPFQRKYGRELDAMRMLAGLLLRQMATDNPRFDRALADAVYALADELRAVASELERVEVNARLDEQNNLIEAGYAIALKGEASSVSQMIRDAGQRSSAAPPFFWELPSSAQSGGYAIAGDPKRWAALSTSAAELLDAYLEHRKLPARARKRVRALLESSPNLMQPTAYVAGSLPASTESAGAAAGEATAAERLLQRVGWYAGVVQARADAVTTPFTELTALLLDPELSRWLKQEAAVDAKTLPKLRSRIVRVQGFAARATAFTIDIPPGLVALLMDVDPQKPAATGAAPKGAAAKLSLVVAADGDLTWLALAPDEKQAIARLAAARAGQDGKLAGVNALSPLRTEPVVSGGFWSLQSLVSTYQSTASRPGSPDLVQGLERAPNRGTTPWLTRTRVESSGPTTRVVATVQVPRSALQDLGSLIPLLLPQGLLGIGQ